VSGDQRRVQGGVPAGGQFATERKAESEVHLIAAPGPAPELLAALGRYGLTLDDVPADHEGVTLLERWDQATALATAEPIPTTTSVLWDQLGDLDTGRHRGGPDPVWWDERATWDADTQLDPATDPDDPRWDDPNATLAAWVHTRNGGGNRECYECDDRHEPGCPAGANDEMQSHPAFLADHDDTGDSTYANFHFRIDDKDAVRAAVRLAPDAAAQSRAARALEQVASGDADPWAVFPVNPDTAAAATAARAGLEALGTADMDRRQAESLGVPVTHTGGSWGIPRVQHVRVSPEHLADFDALLAWASDPVDGPPEDTATWGGGVTQRWHLRTYGETYAERRTVARQAAAATGALASGDLPDDVAAVLRAGLESANLGKFARADQALEETATKLAKIVAVATEGRAALVAGVEKSRERARLKALINPPVRALHWPGSPDTVPDIPEPPVPARDPFDL